MVLAQISDFKTHSGASKLPERSAGESGDSSTVLYQFHNSFPKRPASRSGPDILAEQVLYLQGGFPVQCLVRIDLGNKAIYFDLNRLNISSLQKIKYTLGILLIWASYYQLVSSRNAADNVVRDSFRFAFCIPEYRCKLLIDNSFQLGGGMVPAEVE